MQHKHVIRLGAREEPRSDDALEGKTVWMSKKQRALWKGRRTEMTAMRMTKERRARKQGKGTPSHPLLPLVLLLLQVLPRIATAFVSVVDALDRGTV